MTGSSRIVAANIVTIIWLVRFDWYFSSVLFSGSTARELAGPKAIKAPWSRNFSMVMGSFIVGGANLKNNDTCTLAGFSFILGRPAPLALIAVHLLKLVLMWLDGEGPHELMKLVNFIFSHIGTL